jgi:hypothetical protein
VVVSDEDQMIDFPNTPAVGDLYYAPSNGITYRWDGTLWLAGPNVGSGYGPSGDFCATQTAGLPTGTANTYVTLNPNSIISGNAGNWYSSSTGRYTPPPGRYCLYGSFACWYAAGAMSFTIHLRKNGTEIGTYNYVYSAAANYRVTPTIEVVVDANGTDWFDLQGQCVGAAGTFETATFLAYPITGAKGPPGDRGPLPPSNALVLYNEQKAVGGETQLNVTIPLNAKRVELELHWAAASGDPAPLVQTVESGVVNATNNHGGQQIYATSTTLAAQIISASTSWSIGGTNQGSTAIKFFPRLVGSITWAGIFHQHLIASGGTRYVQVWAIDGGANPATTTGFRATLSASSFLAGSFMRAYVVV